LQVQVLRDAFSSEIDRDSDRFFYWYLNVLSYDPVTLHGVGMRLWLKLAGLFGVALFLGYCANVCSTHQMELGYGYPPTPLVQQIEHDWKRSHPAVDCVIEAPSVQPKPVVRLASSR
jgi:hypothetical protein